ncbi:MAG: histidine--tRNA ligase [Gammaproteobacteria bacterium]|nr:histidine--tRNA ligase [Gammaproteobacteria bacterium]
MAKSLKSIRGMHDVLPEDSPRWQAFEAKVRQLMGAYAYSEIRTPIVESTDLFCRSIGEVTDIVEKEMYTFEDRNGDRLTLRPEGTASCVRAGIQHGILHNQIRRLWYMGPMFRHERPQKGRYRQFHQLGVEAFGVADADVDAELIIMSSRLWRELGLKDLRLELNTLGSTESRAKYKEVLVEYLEAHRDQLDEDSLRRIDKNPLRVLDSKNPELKSLIAEAPDLHDYLDEESIEHFERLKVYLDGAGVAYSINPRLVRGLDYYCKTVFEWVTDSLGAQGTVCAGGRYDGLVEQLGGKASPAAGFAIGMERLLSLMEEIGVSFQEKPVDVYLLPRSSDNIELSLSLAEKLRDALPELKIQMHCGGGSIKSQMKKADKSGAELVLLIGEDESGRIVVKYLRDEREQQLIEQDAVIDFLQKNN